MVFLCAEEEKRKKPGGCGAEAVFPGSLGGGGGGGGWGSAVFALFAVLLLGGSSLPGSGGAAGRRKRGRGRGRAGVLSRLLSPVRSEVHVRGVRVFKVLLVISLLEVRRPTNPPPLPAPGVRPPPALPKSLDTRHEPPVAPWAREGGGGGGR